MERRGTGRIAIVTDSASCLPAEVRQELGIRVVPFRLAWGDETYRDLLDISPSQFYQRFLAGPPYPTTSTPSPGDYLAAFQEEARDADGIVYVHVPARLTSAARVARLAAREVDRPVRLVDAATAGTPEGFVVVAAARAAAQGDDLEGVVRVARRVAQRAGMYVFLDTLEHLQRGGRLGEVAFRAGTRLGIRALLRLAGGRLRFVTARRSRAAATAALLEALRAEVGDDPLRVGVLHGACEDEAQALAQTVRERVCVRELHIAELTPVMGAHAGPGTLGIGYERLVEEHHRAA